MKAGRAKALPASLSQVLPCCHSYAKVRFILSTLPVFDSFCLADQSAMRFRKGARKASNLSADTPTIPFALPLPLLRLRQLGTGKEMTSVDEIDGISTPERNGASVASIAQDTGVSESTARKCLEEPDLSKRPQRSVGRPSRRHSSPSRA